MTEPFSLIETASFKRAARRFLRKHRDLVGKVYEILEQLREDPFEPSLRLHNLTGKLAGKQAVSITYTYRIVLCVEITEHDVILHNIGSHDEVYG